MAYDSRVFQLLIASPSDVPAERKAIAEIVHDWNDLNSSERQVVVLPVRWETHSSPELGEPPQAIINRQLADQCDFVVSAFSTRMGTPTEHADSGTAEEIDRAGNSGKPVMLYFSNAPVPPDEIDTEQLERVRQFKAKTYPQGIVENYDSLQEFRDKFARQLSRVVRTLIESDAESATQSPTGLPIIVALAEGQPPEILPSPISLGIQLVRCVNIEEIPDYRAPISTIPSGGGFSLVTATSGVSSGVNKDYYRDIVEYYRKLRLFRSLRFAIENPSDDGIRDLYFDIQVESKADEATLLFTSDRPEFPRREVEYGTLYGNLFSWPLSSIPLGGTPPTSSQSRQIELGEGGSRMNLELSILQPKRAVYSNNSFFLGADRATDVVLHSVIYSSSAAPALREIELSLETVEAEVTYQEILNLFQIDLPS